MSTRWQHASAPRGDDYDARWTALAARGEHVHGEADLVAWVLGQLDGTRVLDAGCGTGRVAIELTRRGYDVTGLDADAAMLAAAQAKAPELRWVHADLADRGAVPDGPFDVVVMAGNVMIFVAPGTEGRVVGHAATVLAEHGALVAGFQLREDRLTLAQYDAHCAAAGLELAERWSTWDRRPYAGGDYAVSLHRRASAQP